MLEYAKIVFILDYILVIDSRTKITFVQIPNIQYTVPIVNDSNLKI